MKWLWLLLFLMSCGKNELGNIFNSPPKVVKTYRVDPEFNSYVQNFKSTSQVAGKPQTLPYLIVEFKDLASLGAGVLGVCYRPVSGEGTPIIQIDPEYWESGFGYTASLADGAEKDLLIKGFREFLIFHELGHCSTLHYPHRENTVSIMNAAALQPFLYLGVSIQGWVQAIDDINEEAAPSADNYQDLITEFFYPSTGYDVHTGLAGIVFDPDTYASDIGKKEQDIVFLYNPEDFHRITTP